MNQAKVPHIGMSLSFSADHPVNTELYFLSEKEDLVIFVMSGIVWNNVETQELEPYIQE